MKCPGSFVQEQKSTNLENLFHGTVVGKNTMALWSTFSSFCLFMSQFCFKYKRSGLQRCLFALDWVFSRLLRDISPLAVSVPLCAIGLSPSAGSFSPARNNGSSSFIWKKILSFSYCSVPCLPSLNNSLSHPAAAQTMFLLHVFISFSPALTHHSDFPPYLASIDGNLPAVLLDSSEEPHQGSSACHVSLLDTCFFWATVSTFIWTLRIRPLLIYLLFFFPPDSPPWPLLLLRYPSRQFYAV